MTLNGVRYVCNMARVIISSVTEIAIIAKWLCYNHEEYQRESGCELIKGAKKWND